MGRTRFSEVAGDALALGGAGKGMPIAAIPSLYSYGRVINFDNTSDAAFFDNDPAAAPTAAWGITNIGVGPGFSFLPTSGSNPGMRFTFHNAGAALLGADLIWADVGNATVGVIPPPFRQSAAANSSTYEPECFVEMAIRRGTTATGAWTTGVGGSIHSNWWGIVTQAPATTILDTAGAMAQTTNIAGFLFSGAAGTATLQAAGSAGGLVTASSVFFSDTNLNGKHLLFGLRIVGLNKIAYYINRKLVARQVLTTSMTAGPYTFGLSGVTTTAGGDRSLDIAYVAFGGVRRTAEFLTDADSGDKA